MSTDYTVVNNIKGTLKYIGKNYTTDPQATIYLGNLDGVNLESKTNANSLNFVEAMVKGYDAFRTRFASSMPTAVSEATISSIFLKKVNQNVYVAMTDADINFSPKDTEVNFSKVLTPSSELLTILDMLRNVYTFFQENTLNKYKENVKFSVSNYTIGANNQSHVVIDPKDAEQINMFKAKIQFAIGNIDNFNFINNDVFMIRRLMLMYELVSNIYISMHLYDVAVTTNAPAAVTDKLLKIITSTANVLINLNKSFIFSTENGASTNANIIKSINEQVYKASDNSININNLDSNVSNLKTQLSQNVSMYKSKDGINNTAMQYQKIMTAIVITALVVILAVAIMPMENYKNKLVVIITVLTIIVIVAFVLSKIYMGKIGGSVGSVEDFANTSALTNPSSAVKGMSITEKDTTLQNFNTSFRTQMLDYLTISIYLASMLQSGKMYGNINSALRKEITYFGQMKEMISNTNNKLANASAIKQIETLTAVARITFVISLILILGITIVAYMLTNDQPQYQPFIVGLCALFIIVILVRYLFTVSRYVRTDPSKRYWQKPADTKLLDLMSE